MSTNITTPSVNKKNEKRTVADIIEQTNTATDLYKTDNDPLNSELLPGQLTSISVKGARQHNLKNISVEIPRDKITVITGLSGSGKSSLAFDTIYAEGQRRYVDCLSPYARQFLSMMQKPDVDSIEGLSPAISIEQKTLGHNPRSTIGTVTEIYNYLRLFFAKIGIRYCTECDVEVIQKTTDQITAEISTNFINKRIQILAPLVVARTGHYRELFETLRKQGYTKVRIDGVIHELTPGLQTNRYNKHNIEVVIDRLYLDDDSLIRLRNSVEKSCERTDGVILLLIEDGLKGSEVWTEVLFNTKYSCPKCGKSFENLAPNIFSFNSTYGACPTCSGIGETYFVDEDLLIPDKNLSITNKAVCIQEKEDSRIFHILDFFAEKVGIDLNLPYKDLTAEQQNLILLGDKQVTFDTKVNLTKSSINSKSFKYTGLLSYYTDLYNSPSSNSTTKKRVEKVMSPEVCIDCGGSRLKKDSLSVRVHNYNINDIVNSDIKDVYDIFNKIKSNLTPKEHKISIIIIKEILNRLEFLINVGLHYLTLGRSARTLSGGESQRIRLASQIGAKLVGVTYVLDEPSIGLHQHDNYRLIKSLQDLRDLGNTLIVVEHDKAMIEYSDYLIDVGPGAGVNGGQIILACQPNQITTNSTIENFELDKSITSKYLLGKSKIEYTKNRRQGNGKYIKLYKASGNNLKDVDLSLPLGKLVCITGMSGSGKSTLINDTLYPLLSNHLTTSKFKVLPYGSIEGIENIDKIIEIDQSPIGRTPRSNPATYTDLFTHIRNFYAMLPDAKLKGFAVGRFSFNTSGGRCEECKGAGMVKIEMNFMPEVFVTCNTCNGKRYNKETLTVHFKGKSIADVLDMNVATALDFFKDIPNISRKLETLYNVGLGYIKLGQQSPTLSGGEAQRVKLATELSKRSTGKTLYLLDEPTTGLHFDDINLLQKLLDKLVDKGNTVVIIEHNLDVIKCADWVIDIGPEGGKQGGEIVATGTPEEIVKNERSLTGKYLADELQF